MYKITLFCEHGASTGLLVRAIQKAAEEKGIELDIAAYPYSEMANYIEGSNAVILAPQVRFKLNTFKSEFPDYTFLTVDPVDYGMLKGDKILDKILEAIK